MSAKPAQQAIIVDELTPAHLRCTFGACPAVFTLSNGDLLIIGKILTQELRDQIKSRVANDELPVTISPEYLKILLNELSSDNK